MSGKLLANSRSRPAWALSNRNGARCLAARRGLAYRGGVTHQSHGNQPGEETGQDAQKVVIAAGRYPGTGGQEHVEQLRGDRIDDSYGLPNEEEVKQPQSLLLGVEATAQSALVGEELLHFACQGTFEDGRHTISSPSPRATSRRSSTATLE